MEELKKAIEEDITDESNDVEKYLKLADLADEHCPDCGYGFILRGIAREEKQHHKLLSVIKEDMEYKGYGKTE